MLDSKSCSHFSVESIKEQETDNYALEKKTDADNIIKQSKENIKAYVMGHTASKLYCSPVNHQVIFTLPCPPLACLDVAKNAGGGKKFNKNKK
jgi:hypothetical protein